MIGLGVSAIQFKDGRREELPRAGIVVIVGPNNAGKTSLLNEVHDAATGTPESDYQPRKWVESVDMYRQGDEREFDAWFTTIARPAPQHYPQFAGQRGFFDPSSSQFASVELARSWWISGQPLGWLNRILISRYDAGSRASLLQGKERRDPTSSPNHPLDLLYDRRDSEARLSSMVERAFGFPVSINRYANQLDLLMGRSNLPDEVLPPSQELLGEYAKLPQVISQGDGVRSFVGLLLMSVVSDNSLILIDEPEAFLHPPQAKLMGRYLAAETRAETQLVLATHSSDVLEGVLDGAREREVKIIRVSDPSVSGRRWDVLPPSRVQTLWTDPLLRYSRMLDGLFHRGVVVCEADSDCRFYAASLDLHLFGKSEQDLVFTHVGGKARLAVALRDLKLFGLRAAVVADIDILNDLQVMKEIIDAANGCYDDFADDLQEMHAQVKRRLSPPTVKVLRDSVGSLLSRRDTSPLSEGEVRAIRDALKNRSGWSEVKRSGIRAFDSGAYAAVCRVLAGLQALGIFVVPVGELERWFPDIEAGHGPSFVTTVLESRRHENPGRELQDFIGEIAAYFALTPRPS